MAHSGGGQPIEDRGKSGGGDAVIEPICLRRPEKHTIRKGWTENRGEVSIADHVVTRERTIKRKIELGVLSDRIRVICACTQETIHGATVVGHARLVIRMIRIRMWATGVVRCKAARGVLVARFINLGQTR